jgi:hypothetical protein
MSDKDPADSAEKPNISKQENEKSIVSEEDKIQEIKVVNSTINTSGAALAAFTIRNIVGEEHVDLLSIINRVNKQIDKVLEGNTDGMVSVLVSHTMVLNTVFTNMLSRSIQYNDPEDIRHYADIALRAQNQARKTILALEAIKHPKPQTFVAQQNIAGIQQVNNGQLPNHDQNLKPENELLTNEAQYAAMDTFRTAEAIPIDSAMEAMGKVHRRKNTPRQGCE